MNMHFNNQYIQALSALQHRQIVTQLIDQSKTHLAIGEVTITHIGVDRHSKIQRDSIHNLKTLLKVTIHQIII